jgi:hypothetical protein
MVSLISTDLWALEASRDGIKFGPADRDQLTFEPWCYRSSVRQPGSPTLLGSLPGQWTVGSVWISPRPSL